MVILSIFKFTFLFFGVDIELRRRIFGFETGDHRCSPVQAGTRSEISHPKKKICLRVIGELVAGKKRAADECARPVA
jgi:hypothetical protein